jgi:hypothetical protein
MMLPLPFKSGTKYLSLTGLAPITELERITPQAPSEFIREMLDARRVLSADRALTVSEIPLRMALPSMDAWRSLICSIYLAIRKECLTD